MQKFIKPMSGHVVMNELPDFVASVFYRKSGIMAWRNDTGTAFGDGKPHTDKEIKKALTWLAGCFGGYIVWSNTND